MQKVKAENILESCITQDRAHGLRRTYGILDDEDLEMTSPSFVARTDHLTTAHKDLNQTDFWHFLVHMALVMAVRACRCPTTPSEK